MKVQQSELQVVSLQSTLLGAGIAAVVSGGTATVTASGGATTDDVVALAIALG